jgi:hypothetical protein
MKHLSVLVLTTCFLLKCTTSKNHLINETWIQLKASAYKKGEQAKRITNVLWGIKGLQEKVLLSASIWSKRLIVSSDLDMQLDSSNFNNLRQSNDSLDVLMPLVFKELLISQDSLEQTVFVDIEKDYLKAAKKVDSIKVLFDNISKNDGTSYHFASYNK